MRSWLIVLACLAIVGCVTTQTGSRSGPWRATIENRLAQLADQNQWKLQGRLAIHKNDDGFTAAINWEQMGETFDIRLQDPLGRRVAWLTGTPKKVSLTTVDGQSYQGVDPQLLLNEHLGWGIPLDSLVFWIKGIPDPNKVSWREEYDDIGRPTLLDQVEWRVTLSRYDSGLPLALPGLVKLERQGFRARLLIDNRE